jgi:tRNA threonylcarbamoyl adenosine modification protein (Sua5/YciO/YrdC/YwlC family)
VPDYSPYVTACVTALRIAGVVAVPTDTVYGLAIDADNHLAKQKLYRLKGREANKPLVYMTADIEQLSAQILIPDYVRPILAKHWPGALTVIFATMAGGTLGVRIPQAPFMLELLKAYGKPLAVTSANLSGEPEINSAEALQSQFKTAIDVYVPLFEPLSGVASTIIDVSHEAIKVLRQGEIKL